MKIQIRLSLKIAFFCFIAGLSILIPNKTNAQFQYGVVGKKTVDVLSTDINNLKKDLIGYINDSLNKTLNKTATSILDGAIQSLGKPQNQQSINSFIDGLIIHGVGGTGNQLVDFQKRLLNDTFRKQFTAFENSLLNETFRNQLKELLKSVMDEMVINPSNKLVDIITGERTQQNLDKMLRMVIPAVLNDSALDRVDAFRNALLGDAMKKDVSGLVDTALGTVNARLKGELGDNLQKRVSGTAKDVGVQVKDVILYFCVGILILGLVFFFLYSRIIKKKNDMLFTVANSIEEYRKEDKSPQQENFHLLTDKIRENMVRMQLENDMKKFLIKKNINKPSDYN